ncbi:MAG: hypothetical protein IJU78_07470 [Clostridia bacterium]|nr:hypothetical protein [Clostridia bacterium]
MGECIEISILSTTTEPVGAMLRFLKGCLKNPEAEESFAVMDNWEYENQTAVDSLAEAMENAEGKIIFAEAGDENVRIGVFAEHGAESCIIDGWINPQTAFSDEAYEALACEAVKLLRDMKSVLACAVGREMYVDYGKGIAEAVREAHGADLWLLPQSAAEDCAGTPAVKIVLKDK